MNDILASLYNTAKNVSIDSICDVCYWQSRITFLIFSEEDNGQPCWCSEVLQVFSSYNLLIYLKLRVIHSFFYCLELKSKAFRQKSSVLSTPWKPRSPPKTQHDGQLWWMCHSSWKQREIERNVCELQRWGTIWKDTWGSWFICR